MRTLITTYLILLTVLFCYIFTQVNGWLENVLGWAIMVQIAITLFYISTDED